VLRFHSPEPAPHYAVPVVRCRRRKAEPGAVEEPRRGRQAVPLWGRRRVPAGDHAARGNVRRRGEQALVTKVVLHSGSPDVTLLNIRNHPNGQRTASLRSNPRPPYCRGGGRRGCGRSQECRYVRHTALIGRPRVPAQQPGRPDESRPTVVEPAARVRDADPPLHPLRTAIAAGSAGPQLACQITGAGAAVGLGGFARRQPGTSQPDGHRAQDPAVRPAGRPGLQGHRNRLSVLQRSGLLLRPIAYHRRSDPGRRDGLGLHPGQARADRAHLRSDRGR